eukprot:COSAG06_NODE_303_length_17863_cov_13.622326_17_plen_91_part_00
MAGGGGDAGVGVDEASVSASSPDSCVQQWLTTWELSCLQRTTASRVRTLYMAVWVRCWIGRAYALRKGQRNIMWELLIGSILVALSLLLV